MKSEQMVRLRMNLDIYCDNSTINNVIDKLSNLINNLEVNPSIYTRTRPVETESGPMKFVIIDFECYFPKFFGILVSDMIFQFYIKEPKHQPELYMIIFEVLKIVKNFYFVTFSGWESRFIKILKNRLVSTYSPKELDFLDTLAIIDIQIGYYESLTSGLFSVNEKISSEPVLRISNNVDLLFELGYLDLVSEHNESCLISTLKLLHKRFFKLNLLDFQNYNTHIKKRIVDTLRVNLTDDLQLAIEFI